MKKTFIALGLLTLCLGLGLAVFDASREVPTPTLTQPLSEILPTGAEFGWTSEDLPLGATEALEEQSQRMLNLTDFVYRRYTRGRESFDVYIGYWAPGTMPARDMNSHTPDTCWANAGWIPTERQNGRIISEGDLKTKPGLWRLFEKDENSINVIFWHLLEGEPYSYGHQSFNQRISQLILDPFRHGLNMRRDQYLVRISSVARLDNFEDSPILTEILEKLVFTGVVSTES
tara:strand:+ start:962 stop:1654 length:693 start_codon:yes stop_codon:yes gene_type:complete